MPTDDDEAPEAVALGKEDAGCCCWGAPGHDQG